MTPSRTDEHGVLPNCYRCDCQPCECADGIALYHADCLDVLPLLVPGRVDLVLTDPPYGIALAEHGRNGHDWTVAGDADQTLGIAALKQCADMSTIVFASPQNPWPGQWRQHLVWDKGPAVGGGGDRRTCWKFSWELIQVRKTGPHRGQRDSSVLRYPMTQGDYHLHPNAKPLALLRYLITKASYGRVLDPFTGSGTTLRAAKDLGRRAIGIEIEEKYCEIAARRLEQEMLFT